MRPIALTLILLITGFSQPLLAEQITWSYTSSTGSTVYEYTNQPAFGSNILIQAFGTSSGDRTTPIDSTTVSRFSPLNVTLDGFHDNVDPSGEGFTILGNFVLHHADSGDEEKWALSLDVQPTPDGDVSFLGVSASVGARIEGDGLLGTTPYTLYDTKHFTDAEQSHLRASGPLGISFDEPPPSVIDDGGLQPLDPIEPNQAPIAPAPEPTSLTLMLIGAGVAGMRAWRRRRS